MICRSSISSFPFVVSKYNTLYNTSCWKAQNAVVFSLAKKLFKMTEMIFTEKLLLSIFNLLEFETYWRNQLAFVYNIVIIVIFHFPYFVKVMMSGYITRSWHQFPFRSKILLGWKVIFWAKL